MARSIRGALAPAVALALVGWGAADQAQAQETTAAELAPIIGALRTQMADQAARLAEQERILAEQKALLERQGQELERLHVMSDQVLQAARGAGAPQTAAPAATIPSPITIAQARPVVSGPPGPVGEAPPLQERVEVAALPEGSGVLTPRGRWIVEPTFDYTHASANRLVFRGVEIVTGVQVGVIEASDADRNAISGAVSVRYGLTDRLEVEVRAPYLYRSDRVTTLAQRDETITRTFELEGQDIGDVELGARYQLNSGLNGWPVFLAGLRVKSDTGTNSFEIPRDEFGISTELPTGSGFWGVETSLTFLYPTDPAVIFGGVSYMAHLSKSINRQVGEVMVGEVDPGDSIGVNFGFGLALNPRFSVSLGYKHYYILETESDLGPTRQSSESLQVGALTFGVSFSLNDRITLATSYEVGTTDDAPDMRITLRIPIRF